MISTVLVTAVTVQHTGHIATHTLFGIEYRENILRRGRYNILLN